MKTFILLFCIALTLAACSSAPAKKDADTLDERDAPRKLFLERMNRYDRFQ
jgi:hypothetical protein